MAAASCSSAPAPPAGPGPGPGPGSGSGSGPAPASSSSSSSGPGPCEWLLLRDGCLRCDAEGLRSLCYHPALNAILAVTARGAIKVIDGTSGATLQASALNGERGARGEGGGGGRRRPVRVPQVIPPATGAFQLRPSSPHLSWR